MMTSTSSRGYSAKRILNDVLEMHKRCAEACKKHKQLLIEQKLKELKRMCDKEICEKYMPKKGETVHVSDHPGEFHYFEREFLFYDPSNRCYVCRCEGENRAYFGWTYCRPLPPKTVTVVLTVEEQQSLCTEYGFTTLGTLAGYRAYNKIRDAK